MMPPLKNILEAALMAAGGPLSLERMQTLFDEHETPSFGDMREALTELKSDLLGRGIELTEVASGYRLQVRTEVAPWVARLWEERPQRYSRALLETLALIAYRQPITRGDIEDVRGVVVSSSIMKTLLEREWVRVVGYRDVPGRPAMYATTREFLDYFGLKSLEDLPSLMEIKDLDDANRRLELGDDAEARKEPAKEYDFVSDDDIAQRGADVLAETDDDLAAAAELVARVEKNLFTRDEEEEQASAAGNEQESVSDFHDLVARLAAKPEARTDAEQETRSEAQAESEAESGEESEPEDDSAGSETDDQSAPDAGLTEQIRADAPGLFNTDSADSGTEGPAPEFQDK